MDDEQISIDIRTGTIATSPQEQAQATRIQRSSEVDPQTLNKVIDPTRKVWRGTEGRQNETFFPVGLAPDKTRRVREWRTRTRTLGLESRVSSNSSLVIGLELGYRSTGFG
ncbi:hypothetical protein VTN00DRAFT_5744 [Thermoascus crustaceus]|uniref:uncharacterized protein n=1 Tax=Thermoascus crustaceus TaxID=5088 RepID=UPI0037439DC8